MIGHTLSPNKVTHNTPTQSSGVPLDIDKEDENTTDAVALAAITMSEMNISSLTDPDDSQIHKPKRGNEDPKKNKNGSQTNKLTSNKKGKGRPVSKCCS